MKFVRNVTWEEIREAERLGEKEMSFELEDILEDVDLSTREVYDKIIENIEYLLKEEGLYDPTRMGVELSPWEVSYIHCNTDEECYYKVVFDVYDKTTGDVLAKGIAYGSGNYFEKDGTMGMLDMNIYMPTKFVKKLKRMVETLKHVIWGDV